MSIVQKTQPTLPSVFTAFGQDDFDEFSAGVSQSVSVLSIKGRNFHVRSGGETHTVVNDEGDPVSTLKVILLRASPTLSKEFYRGGWSEENEGAPICASADGQKPDAGVAEPQSKSCAVCPHNQWGSRVTEQGQSKGKACQDKRRVAVVSHTLEGEPMLLRVPADSLKNLKAYADALKRRGFPPFAVVTKLGFEQGVSYPKLAFKPEAAITDDEFARKVMALRDSEAVLDLLKVGSTAVADAPAATAPEPEKPLQQASGVFAGANDDDQPRAKAAPKAPEPEVDPMEDFDLSTVSDAPAPSSKSAGVEPTPEMVEAAKGAAPAAAETETGPIITDFDELFSNAGVDTTGIDPSADEEKPGKPAPTSDELNDMLGGV